MGQNLEGKRHPVSRKNIDQLKEDLREGKFDKIGKGDIIVACGEQGCTWKHLGKRARVVEMLDEGRRCLLQWADGSTFHWGDLVKPDECGVYWKHASA